MKKLAVILFLISLYTTSVLAQKMEAMQWFNEPDSWGIDNGKLTMEVTPQTDYWNKTHYGFTVNDAPFLYTERGGEFEVIVEIEGEYKTRFDQMGLMLRIDENHWVKTGIEYVDGVYNFSTVHTIDFSSWSVITLEEKPKSVWIKAKRKLDAVEIFYSLDGKNYQMSNIVYFPDNTMVKVGMMAASPDGDGFTAIFENFRIKHLPDSRRVEWLKQNN